MAISEEKIDDACQAIKIFTGLDGLSTELTQGMLIWNCPALTGGLQNGDKWIDLPNHDMDTFDILRTWMCDHTVPEPWDNSDIIGLMQVYDLAFFLEMPTACTDFFEAIQKFVSRTRLNVHVINETSYIPKQCRLRDYLRIRLLEELIHLHNNKQLVEVDDGENSLWQESCVAEKLAEVILKEKLDNRAWRVDRRAKKRLTKRIAFDFLSPNQKQLLYNEETMVRVWNILGMHPYQLVTRRCVPHNAIQDEEIIDLWTVGWNLKYSGEE